jgi:hypothetical protein
MTRVSPSGAGVWRVQIQHGQTWRTVSEVRGFKSDALREARKIEERTATLREYHARNDGGTE